MILLITKSGKARKGKSRYKKFPQRARVGVSLVKRFISKFPLELPVECILLVGWVGFSNRYPRRAYRKD